MYKIPFTVKNNDMVRRFIVYSMLGIYLEILWTGMRAAISGEYTMTGHSSVIMMFIYGGIVCMEPVFRQLKDFGIAAKGIIYSLLIFAAEYFSGLLLLKYNICPWDYSYAFYNVRGVIRFDYMPVWFVVGLMYERLYFVLSANNNK